jgi:hypothetical protein
LVRPASRSGFANLVLVPRKRGQRVTYGSEVEWKHKFTPAQMAAAPASLQVILEANEVAILPKALTPEASEELRRRGFAVAPYVLDDAERLWILSNLPADKATKWQASGKDVTMVTCLGGVTTSSVKAKGDLLPTEFKICAPPLGTKLEEVAKVENGGIVSDLSAAIGDSFKSVYEWVVPSSVKNAYILSSDSVPSEEQKAAAKKFLADYEDMADSVRSVESLMQQGATLRREQQVRLQISKMILAQYAQPVAKLKESLGQKGSTNHERLFRSTRRRVRLDYGALPAIAAGYVILGVVVCLSLAAGVYWLSQASIESSRAKQKELDVQLRKDLLANCSDPNMPEALRKEVCGALREESKRPTGANPEESSMADLLSLLGYGAVGVAGAVGLVYLVRSGTFERASNAVRQRVSRRKQGNLFNQQGQPYAQGE